MKMDSDLFTSSYYVYAKGEIVLATDNVRQAVSAADSNMGVVVDGSMDYIWERAKADSRSAVSLSDPRQQFPCPKPVKYYAGGSKKTS